MASILPESELLRRAVAWLCEERAANPEKSLHALLDEAGMRYNLSPVDQHMLAALFVGEKAPDGLPGDGREY